MVKNKKLIFASKIMHLFFVELESAKDF